MAKTASKSLWAKEGRDLIRGSAAGLIFGTPLLYTMEMWWHGLTFSSARMVLLLAAVLLINTVICLFLGFRARYDLLSAAMEAVESVALAFIIAVSILFLIGEIDFGSSLAEILGKCLTQAVVISLGIAIANAKFPCDDDEEQSNQKSKESSKQDSKQEPASSLEARSPEQAQLLADLKDVGAGLAGATLFAFNVAPTEEVIKIASRLDSIQLGLLFIAEIGICYIILFASGFWQREVHTPDSQFQKPWAETLLCSAFSFAVAGVLIGLVGYHEQVGTWDAWIRSTIVLGLPAVTGGAAGRLAL
ncbi:MAG: DUF2391 family protein [Proteobacteria bacterium]|nr:MAG: DUF2391 family protein [Pseudomonadota bacterium]